MLGVPLFELLHPSLEVIDVDGTGEIGLFGVRSECTIERSLQDLMPVVMVTIDSD